MSTYLRFFWHQIGQLFEVQRVFEVCLEIDKSLLSKENVVDFGILYILLYMNGQLSKKLASTYVCYDPDGLY